MISGNQSWQPPQEQTLLTDNELSLDVGVFVHIGSSCFIGYNEFGNNRLSDFSCEIGRVKQPVPLFEDGSKEV